MLKKLFYMLYRLKEKIKLTWYRHYYTTILNAKDKKLTIFGKPIIKYPEKIIIGNNCRINDYAFLHGGGGIIIGDNVTISAFAKIISIQYDTGNWEINYLTKRHIYEEVYIGDGCWIGAGAIILPGVKIKGKGVIIAAGSLVNKNIEEDFCLVAGIPAKIVKRYV